MPESSKVSLVEFASHAGGRPATAWLTKLPEFEEIVAAWESGIDANVIRTWLIQERNYPIAEVTDPRVGGWLRRNRPRA